MENFMMKAPGIARLGGRSASLKLRSDGANLQQATLTQPFYDRYADYVNI